MPGVVIINVAAGEQHFDRDEVRQGFAGHRIEEVPGDSVSDAVGELDAPLRFSSAPAAVSVLGPE